VLPRAGKRACTRAHISGLFWPSARRICVHGSPCAPVHMDGRTQEGGLKQCGLADDGWIKSWYVLNAPIAKFTLAFVCELALALIFTLVPIDELARDDLCPLLLAWLGSAFAWEAHGSHSALPPMAVSAHRTAH
jgi:hypothetical protein